MAFPNVSDIVATTIQSRSRQIADNVTKNNALLSRLNQRGNIKTISGGSSILEELSFAENGNAGFYSGYDLLPVAAQDVISAAEFSIKRQIEDLKRTDEALYQIYALGEKAISKSNIYSNWSFVKHRPARFVNFVYGLDFGYNHPTALMRVYWCDNDIYIEPVIYESYLTTTNLIERMQQMDVEKNVTIVADYARPEIIAEMNNAGYDVQNANKVVKKGMRAGKQFVKQPAKIAKKTARFR